MGMDISGINPKANKSIEDFPTFAKYKRMERDEEDGFQKKWKELDSDEKLRSKYWKEEEAWNAANPGVYFRNNVWWWRPLWNYCGYINDIYHQGKLISNNVFESGHCNDGAGLNDRDAAKLGVSLMTSLEDGTCEDYETGYKKHLASIPDDDCGRCDNNNRGNNKKKDCKMCDGKGTREPFAKSYPFEKDNVENFANFCIQSGGFEIW
jgi:DnaJ-class molecular chaperone